MKGDMEVEVFKDTSEADSRAKAKRRHALIEKSPAEMRDCVYDPEGAKDQTRPGYMRGDY